MKAPVDLRDVRFQRDVTQVHRLGPRVVAELLAELGARRMCRTEIDALLARYARISPAALHAAGGREWLA